MSGGSNHSRITSMSYPNGRVITSDYGTSGGLNDRISRLNTLKDGSTSLEGYSYLGFGTVVERLHPESGVDLSYVKLSGESTGDAGDQYTGLDRFGRVIDQRWRTSSGTSVDRYQYGYDRNSNRTFRDNVVNTEFGEVYSYDGLNQLVNTQRGTLDSSKTGVTGTPSLEQSWNYDALGNWNGATTNGTTQTRTHNQQNEITAVSGATTPTYDANGNMTTDETGKQFVYDAWNFLKVVKDSSGTTLETFNYDALKRKIQIIGSDTVDLDYSAAWQVIEERESGLAVVSYVWSPVYVDAMISRDRDTDTNGTLDERLYVLHDANFNVTGLVNTSGTVVERFTYEPFGKAEIRDASWAIKSGGSGYAWLYLHQGGRFDSVSGLYAFRMREYSPTLGRWMTNDPIEYRAGDVNLFGFVLNDPLNFNDPSGLDPLPREGSRSFDDIRKAVGFTIEAISAKIAKQLGDGWELLKDRTPGAYANDDMYIKHFYRNKPILGGLGGVVIGHHRQKIDQYRISYWEYVDESGQTSCCNADPLTGVYEIYSEKTETKSFEWGGNLNFDFTVKKAGVSVGAQGTTGRSDSNTVGTTRQVIYTLKSDDKYVYKAVIIQERVAIVEDVYESVVQMANSRYQAPPNLKTGAEVVANIGTKNFAVLYYRKKCTPGK
jgi:RHS repeat-associated protein